MADTRPYIRLRKCLPDDPRVQDLAEHLRIEDNRRKSRQFYVTFAVGLLARFWIDCDEFTDADGMFCGGSVEVLRRKYGRFPEEKLRNYGWFASSDDGTPIAVNYKGRKALAESGTDRASRGRATDPDRTGPTHTIPTKTGSGSGVDESEKDGPSSAGILGTVTVDLLSNDTALQDWYEAAVQRAEPFANGTHENRLAVFALAERALAIGKNPAALFVSYLKKQEWHKVGDQWDQAGQARLKRLRGSNGTIGKLAANIGGGHV